MPDVIATASGPVSASTYCALLEAYYKDLGCNVIAEIANPIYSSENIDDNDCQAFNEKVETSVQCVAQCVVYHVATCLNNLHQLVSTKLPLPRSPSPSTLRPARKDTLMSILL